MLRTAAIVANPTKPDALGLAERALALLEARGLEITLEEDLAHGLGRPDLAAPLEALRPDLLVVIGGDGTVLRACLRLSDNRPLILAVNAGGRGFLTTVEPGELEEAINACLSGSFEVEERARVEASADGVRLPDALNEVCLTSKVPVKLLGAVVYKGDELLMALEGDGLIIATPTGSTGYSLSCGAVSYTHLTLPTTERV